MYDFYKKQIVEKTQSLTMQQSALYSLYNCEKIIEMYKMIVDQYNVGNYFLIKQMSYYLWDNIYKYKKNEAFESNFIQMNDYVPNSDSYPGVANAIALNVVICLDIAYKCITGHSNNSNLSGLYVYDTLRQCLLSKRPDIKYITKQIISEIDQTSIILELKFEELSLIENIESKVLNRSFVWDIFSKAQSNKYNYDLIKWNNSLF
ncbi:hypothetical protein HMPREF0673_00363 [Leyella stercorea DSM 18206]|uniref:Uncharacterized protein n=2 Tax=Bacteroidales TaxID=171549 RepID=S0FDP7_9BACT|nr:MULTISPECIES: DUF416 family protein [Bacteroidales]EEF78360.1 hypothetical protein BACCOPRO_03887 [Phocaeicola coprophilus DSM 18228 = JCM 13818]EHJ41826.1 hypothetical protein HMPREF0673_00363 [Leyella stercorea DSM 18206]QRO23548.1 DUF416 family protein [Phocaeicola coprophilus]